MSFQLINNMALAMYNVFGGSLMLPLVILGFIISVLLIIKAGKTVILIILVPLTTALVTVGTSSFFAGMTVDAQWIPVVAWLATGLIMAGVFWKIIS